MAAFIVFEGLKGSGRKTQIRLLTEKLQRLGMAVTSIIFPNFETEIARVTRRGQFDPHTLSLLYAADRSQYQKRIRALLDSGQVVISDRYCYSNFAYQSVRGIPLEWLIEIERHIIKPSMVFLIDVPLATSMERIQQSSIEDFTKKEILTKLKAAKEQLENIRATYLRLAKIDKESKWFVIDGTMSIADVQNQIWQAVAKELKIEG